ncbi:uncharacterized protein LOC132713059 [Ruditapes philippinarum]|uniref:uncharacterized protein LOC132713059 n=1 Tax=Ruditapes philippinarum TaxID=129788 RepID=UPI00295B3CE5|nr:uncharacterized protein LOC132713059 [Ruditapes philippinarum]
MAYSEQNKEIWVSGNGSIDIVNCKDFKVDTDKRINLKILLRICKIHPDLCVGQMTCIGSQMFCMLSYSPFVLEFDAGTYECKSILSLEEYSLVWKLVSRDFPESDHDAYHGVATAGWSGSMNTEKSDDDNSDNESEDETFESTNFDDTATFWKDKDKQRAKSQPINPDHESIDDSFGEPPLIPRRTNASRKACKLLGIHCDDNVTKSCIENQVVPPRPPRPITDFVTKPRRDKPPPIPPKGASVSSYCNKGEKSKVCKKSSFSLPNLPKHTGYNIELTSILIVKNSLWIGRSSGDICIVNIHRAKSGVVDRFGKCVASMFDLNIKQKKIHSVKDLQLVKAGKHVASAYTINDENGFSDIEIAFWESYGVEDVERIEKYWGHILSVEKELLENNKEAKPVSQDIGEF